ncbi:MAG: hypothetical protein H0W84_01170 [Bacteroidetes bacterium]|nr:hypothetical protein [Bacteroidota bacterium]
MKRQISLFSILLSIHINCIGQILSTQPIDIPIGPTTFNPAGIKKNKIKSVLVIIMDKPDGSVIIDKGATQGYEFDLNGNLTRYYYTVLDNIEVKQEDVPAIKKRGRIIQGATTQTVTKYINDTIFANVFYDNQNRIISKRVRTGDYYDAYYYEYNEQGYIKKEMHFKETNISEDKNEFKLGVQNILSAETFTYTELTSTQIKKQCFNDEGREYKKAIINYDAKGNKLSENYEFIVSWMRQETSYKYDSNNNLQERLFITNESGDLKEYSVFENSPGGLLLSEKKFKNNILLYEISYLYDEASTFVRAQVSRDHKRASIGIVKYNYTFY